jgi:hypothetical protein
MSENSTKRTPGPWITSPHNRVGVFDSQKRCIAVTYNGVSVHDIGLGEQEANAAFIVTACNAYNSLVSENARLRSAIEDAAKTMARMAKEFHTAVGDGSLGANILFDAESRARAALGETK